MYQGFFEACKKWNFPIIGGNLSKGPCWIIDIALVGKANANDKVMLRKGIKNGDNLWITGQPGLSAAGLCALQKWKTAQKLPKEYLPLIHKHIKPLPRIEIARSLAENPHVHAMIDVSDGLSKECHTLAFENHLGITLELPDIALSNPLRKLSCQLKKDPLDWVLHGGEDYELLFSASPKFDPLSIQSPFSCPIMRIGVCSKNVKGVYFKHNNGILTQVAKSGWDHIKKPLPL
jgi:thiamine-monophosphate kinase